MSKTIALHYIYDPLCGWCYGAAPLLEALQQLPGVTLHLHAGGLWLNERRQQMGQALRDYVKPHDLRIASLSGQVFGERYFNELLLNTELVLDSAPPISAILAVEAAGGNPLQMLHRIQQSHYLHGQWVGDAELLATLAEEQGLERERYNEALARVALTTHIAASHQMMHQSGSQGYPTVLFVKHTEIMQLPLAQFYGDPAGLCRYVNQQLT